MSDEQPPPSLRLRPRAAVPTDSNPEPVAPASPPAEPTAPQLPTESVAAEEPASLDALPASESGLADPFRLRLKPKTPPPEGTTVETPLPFSNPPIPSAPVAATPPPDAVSVPLAVPPTAMVPPPPRFQAPRPPVPITPPRPIHLPTPRALTDPVSAPPAPAHTIKADKWLAGAVALILVLGGTIYGIRYISAHPKPKLVGRVQATPKPAEATTPAAQTPAAPVANKPHLVEHPISNAGKTIAQARDVIAASDRREQEEGTTSVLADQSATPNKQPVATPSAIVASTPSAPSVVDEPAVTKDEPPPPPSDAFRQFVINMRVNGVFQGENARAMLNGKMYRVGDVVEPKLEISLFKVDPEAKQLVFKDSDGAIMTRRY